MDAAPPPPPPSPPPNAPSTVLLHPAPPTAPVDPPGFVPLCRSCGFNLSGLPDGPCPECGTPFVLNALRVIWSAQDRRRRRGFRPLLPAALLLITAFAALGLRSDEGPWTALWFLACLAALGVWFHSRRSE